MATLTYLEDTLRQSPAQAGVILLQLRAARYRTEKARHELQDPHQYRLNTLLLEALIQAEDIISVIYYRYHNSALAAGE